MKQFYLAALAVIATNLNAQPIRRSTWTGLPRTTVAERLATKYDTQAQALQHSSGHGFQKMPRKSYKRYYKEHMLPEKIRAHMQNKAKKKKAMINIDKMKKGSKKVTKGKEKGE